MVIENNKQERRVDLLRNPQKDLETIQLLRSKQWFNYYKGNLDLAEMCEYWINKCQVLTETVAEYEFENKKLEDTLEEMCIGKYEVEHVQG